MFTAAANFHHARFLGFFAVFTTELAAFFGRTITGSVCALAGYFFRHETEPPTQLAGRSVVGGCRELMLGRIDGKVKTTSTSTNPTANARCSGPTVDCRCRHGSCRRACHYGPRVAPIASPLHRARLRGLCRDSSLCPARVPPRKLD